MNAMAPAPPTGSLSRRRLRLIAAEVLKIRTTRAWWLFVGGGTLLSVLSAAFSWESNNSVLHPTLSDYPAGTGRNAVIAQAALARTTAGAVSRAASMMTSGQVLLVLITLMLGVHVATNEYGARTMTATFLVEPHRSRVVLAKMAVSGLFGAAFWAIATAVDGLATPFFLSAEHLPAAALGSPTVVRAVLMELLALVLWALFGLGLGAVLRNQVVAVVAAIAVYAGGFLVIELIIHLLFYAFHAQWLLGLAVLAPAQAANVMITTGQAFQDAPAWWAGGLVLAGYGVALTAIGAARVSRCDVV